jgi:hypothetical protein
MVAYFAWFPCLILASSRTTIPPGSGFQWVVSRGSRDKDFRDTGNFGGDKMLWTLFVILLVLWLLGVVSSYTLGGFIHILLVLAVIALVFQLISGRRTVV